jgi:glycosyltransferase involved in cell wall biosynthesis
MSGGADYHIKGVIDQLKMAGHEVESLRLPFRFSPEKDIETLMEFSKTLDFNRINGVAIDKVISLQFPAYGVQHDNHTVWVMHQHRAVYELYEQQVASGGVRQLKEKVQQFDNEVLSQSHKLYANSERVAARLLEYNQLRAEALYHPPYNADLFFNEDDYGYIFCPSRLEQLKRQDLLINALKYCKTPVKAIIAGDGGQREQYQLLIDKNDLGDRVRLIGKFTESQKLAYYARALAVFFAPYDEDYGYISLEAMLSAKAVITCKDSGGPLEFINHNENGFVLDPDPEQIAEVLDKLYNDRALAKAMGMEGRDRYFKKNISWSNVVEKLLA